MSRLTGSDALGLFEAYQAVYAPQELTEEQVWEGVEEWVNSLLEEGYDLSDYTWEEMYEEYLEENTTGGIGSANRPGTAAQLQQRSRNVQDRGGVFGQAYRAINRSLGAKEPSWDKADRDDRRKEQTALNRSSNPNWKPSLKQEPKKEPKLEPKLEPNRNRNIAATTPVTPKVTPTKPAAAAQTGDKTKDMATFAKANPALAAAAAERARTRGTSQSDNPLMKGMPGKRPMTPSVQSPTLAKDLGKGSGNQSLLNNPNASKSAPPKATPTPTVAPKPATTPAAGNTLSQTAAAVSKPTAFSPTPAAKPTLKKPIVSGFDMFDVVKGYLIGEGYADTEEAALAIMANMSEEWRESIVEERAPGVRPYKAGPTQAEVRADAKRAAKKKVEKDKDKEGYGPEEKFKDWKLTSTPNTVNKKGETISQRMDKEAPYKTRPFSPLFTKQGSRTASAVTRATEGPGEPQSVTMPRKKSKPSREIVRRNKDTNESYNIILSYLLDEGYANSVEAAESIMVSMSEDWVLSIIG